MVATVVDDVDLLFLIVAQVLVAFKQLGVAEDRVHRRADLVGHIGEEGALRPAGAFRGLLGGAQLGGAAGDERFEMLLVLSQFVDELLAFALSADQIRDIPVDADHAHGPAVRAADRLSHAANGADRRRPPAAP